MGEVVGVELWELEIELIQSHMTQNPMLRGEVVVGVELWELVGELSKGYRFWPWASLALGSTHAGQGEKSHG